MPIPTDAELADADKRRRAGIVAIAIAVPAAAMVAAQAGHPELGLAALVLGVAGAGIAGMVRGGLTHEGSDERAREGHRRAGAFAWMVTTVAIVVVTAWMQIMHGVRAAEPFVALGTVSLVSYASTVLWRRWRGVV